MIYTTLNILNLYEYVTLNHKFYFKYNSNLLLNARTLNRGSTVT